MALSADHDHEPRHAADLDAETGQHGGVQSVDRALAVLEILARDGHAGVSDIAEEMGIHKSTVSRLLGSLVSREMVHQNSERGKYQLGFGILRLASSIPGRLSLVREARPVLEALADQFKETVNITVARDGYAVTQEEFEIGINSMSVPVYSHLGTVIGAISISGPAFRFDPAKEPGLAGGLKEAGLQVSAKMGYTPR